MSCDVFARHANVNVSVSSFRRFEGMRRLQVCRTSLSFACTAGSNVDLWTKSFWPRNDSTVRAETCPVSQPV